MVEYKEVKVYVDGTFYNNMYGGGYCVFHQDKLVYQDAGIGKNDPELLSMRNISGEMTAAMHAVLWINKNAERGIIVHDYTGLAKWVTGEWQPAKKYTQKYAQFMRPYYLSGKIQFQWVKGHKGINGNEIADKLAKQAVIYNEKWKI